MEIKMQFVLLLFVFTVVSSFNPKNKFCLLPSCPDGSHTMCLYDEDKASHLCGIKLPSTLSNVEETSVLLAAHNRHRIDAFRGLERRGQPGPQPPSTQNPILVWDDDLAEIAQRWSDQCVISNDKCRNTEDYFVGQNFISAPYLAGMNKNQEAALLQSLVKVWFEEVQRFDNIYVKGFSKFSGEQTRTLNYTQLVWGDTTDLGCGTTRYSNYDSVTIFLVCNFGPGGNISGQAVYTIRK